jgi:hypothetical protein
MNLEWMLWNSLQGKHSQQDRDKPAYVQIILEWDNLGKNQMFWDDLGNDLV